MHYLKFLIQRLILYFFVILFGVTVVFFIPRFLPTDPVESLLGKIQSQGQFIQPEQLDAMRNSLMDSFGLRGTLFQQYLRFLKRTFISFDFGPSLAMFPTPVMTLIKRALPWSIGLLMSTAIIAWLIGNCIGLYVGIRQNKMTSHILESIAMFIYPIPYYILAIILIILFTYIFPIFPLDSPTVGMSLDFKQIMMILHSSILPALSIIIIGLGWWIISMKALSTGINEEEYTKFARMKGLKERKVVVNYVARNAALPQITMLALQLGMIFNGALVTEILFNYPGVGSLIHMAVLQGDYNLLMGTITISIVAVSTATLVVDLVYPLLDPRIRY